MGNHLHARGSLIPVNQSGAPHTFVGEPRLSRRLSEWTGIERHWRSFSIDGSSPLLAAASCSPSVFLRSHHPDTPSPWLWKTTSRWWAGERIGRKTDLGDVRPDQSSASSRQTSNVRPRMNSLSEVRIHYVFAGAGAERCKDPGKSSRQNAAKQTLAERGPLRRLAGRSHPRSSRIPCNK